MSISRTPNEWATRNAEMLKKAWDDVDRLQCINADLLAALQDALEALSWHGGLDFQNDAGQPVGDLIRCAIARAKGEA
jgi:hypothetical protein